MGSPQTLPSDFFENQKAPDSLPAEFFGPSSGERRQRHTLTGHEDPKKSAAAQAADLIEGTAKYSSGALLPAAILAPGSTLAGVAGSYLAGKGGEQAASAMGASPDAARLTGDLAATGGGALAAKYGTRAAKAIAPESILGKLSGYASGIRDRWNALGPPPDVSASFQRGANAPWRNLPASTPPSGDTAPIPGQLPSGRVPGPVASQPQTYQDKQRLPMWHMVRESAVQPAETAPIPGQLPSGRTGPAAPQPNLPTPSAKSVSTERGANASWRLFPESQPASGSTEPIKGVLPSGRTPGPSLKTPSNATQSSQDAPQAVSHAKVLADMIRKSGVTAERVREIPKEGWELLANHAGFDHAPDQATIDAAIAELSKPQGTESLKVRRKQAGR